MKKNFVYAMMSAIALTGAVCFSSCSSSDDLSDVNPTYDGEKVKTAFTISVGDVTSPTTRMATEAVQGEMTKNTETNVWEQTPVFKGMTDIYLFPFKSDVTKENAASTNISESYIHLADFDAFDDPVKKAQGKIYNDVTLSVGVKNFLFYGAIDFNDKGNGALKPSYLEMTDDNWATSFTPWAPVPIVKGTTKVGDLTFDLVPIRRGWTIKDVQNNEKAIATIKPLKDADEVIANAIAGIEAAANPTDAETAEKELLKEIQKTLRNVITEETVTTYKAYAGSSKSIMSLMEMLYNTVKNKEAVLSSSASNIIDKIDDSFTATANADGYYKLSWRGTDPGFPANLGIPDGAAAVQYLETNPDPSDESFVKGFNYVTPSVEGLDVPAISNYTYPARLYYTVNSPSMVKDQIFLKNAGDNYATWSALAGQYTAGPVASNTQSVIMEKQVQYAVGRLDVYVRVKPETVLLDNSADENGNTAAQPVSVPTDGYELTGVLIGGQKQVGWDFTPIDGADEMIIWDNSMTSTIEAKQGTAFAGPNHTLALETKAGTTGSAINIALEFVNKGNDFCGVDHNVIPAGTKFYLVAQLDPSTNETYYVQNPETPWTASTTELIRQVIKQDYVTTVNLTLGATSLQHAYNVVPDLRSPKLEFGLSVDLHWRTGITFDIEL